MTARLPPRPAEPGMTLAEVRTPALLVERSLLDANIAALAGYLAQKAPGLRLRPHAKTHKSPDVARLQIAAGAVGVCCQTVLEMEAMAAGGIGDILLTNQIADAGKAARLAALAVNARVSVCVDDPVQVALLAEAAQAAGVTLDILVELDVGARRCGAPSPQAAVGLAQAVAAQPSLRFTGLQAYFGGAQHMRAPEERRAAIASAAALAAEAQALARAAGLACDTITGAGTGTFELEAASGVYTELQCGSYVFMDADYTRNRRDPASGTPVFAQALSILATVISRPVPDRVVCDAGLKAMSLDSGPPGLTRQPGLVYLGPSDEHSTLELQSGEGPAIGDRLRLDPGHCDPTVAMHDWIVVHEGDRVTDLWPVARGW